MDPLIYRLCEMVMVNGPAWKVWIEEEFGIISAIDFDMMMQRVANPKGDRVQLTMSGNFLPYKLRSEWKRVRIRLQAGITGSRCERGQQIVRRDRGAVSFEHPVIQM